MIAVPAFLVRLLHYRAPRCRLGPEDREARDFADQLRAWTLEGRMRCVWWHTASELAGGGGKSAQVRYAVAKALGLIPGSPDYVFAGDGSAFLLELKAPGGSLTESQRDFRDWCLHCGVTYAVAKGAEAAKQQVTEWGLVR